MDFDFDEVVLPNHRVSPAMVTFFIAILFYRHSIAGLVSTETGTASRGAVRIEEWMSL